MHVHCICRWLERCVKQEDFYKSSVLKHINAEGRQEIHLLPVIVIISQRFLHRSHAHFKRLEHEHLLMRTIMNLRITGRIEDKYIVMIPYLGKPEETVHILLTQVYPTRVHQLQQVGDIRLKIISFYAKPSTFPPPFKHFCECVFIDFF